MTEGDFRDFARHHATSPEIGRIGTYLDDSHEVKGEPRLFGLYGCGKLCAAVCCWVRPSNIGDFHVCKLDSVIVHDRLRKRGLGSILVYKAFLDVVTDLGLEIAKIYTHAVHPATVRMLSRLLFSKPPLLGAVCAAVDAVAKAEVTNAFCAVRPPGHHAEPSRTLGFCLFGNISIGARHAQMVHGLTRVAAIYFDVHHGNGTQKIFKNDENLFFASTHQSFIFPSSTSADERDEPNLVNVCLARGWGGKEFRRLFEEKVLPRLVSFVPELIMISAGFDALRQDPIGDLNLDDSDFFWATEKLTAIAARCCEGRLVSALEGGYNPGATSFACAAHVRALMAA